MCFDDPRLVLFGENQWAVAAFFSQKIIQTEEILQQTLWFNRASWSCKVQNGDGWDENFRVWGFVFFLMYFRDVGSGWVGTNAWCKMENLSGIVQNGDVWDENLRVWGFVFFLMYFRDVGSGWVGTNAWCKMENLSGIVQNGDVWDENLRVWGFVFFFKCIFVMLVQDGSAPMRGVRWRTCPALFKTGMCEMKILGSEVSCFFKCIFVMLVQDGSAPMRGVKWRTCQAKFKTEMCEMKILGSEVSCFF